MRGGKLFFFFRFRGQHSFVRLGAGEEALGGETGPLLTPPLSTVGWLTVGRFAKPKKVETLKIKPLKQNKNKNF